jgi:hypothetical protein
MTHIDSDALDVQAVNSVDEVASVFGLDMSDDDEATRARHIYTVLEESDGVAIRLDNTWWGNEAFGVWAEWFVVHPDGVSPSGKALFVRDGIALEDPIRHLRRADSRSESGNGWTSKAVRRARSKALKNWSDDYMVGPGGGDGFDSRDYFEDESTPISVIETAVATPVDADHLIFDSEGSREGALSDGDIQVVGTTETRYGKKFVLAGETYAAFKEDGVEDEIPFHNDEGPDAHHTYNGNAWVCDMDGVSLVIEALVDAGYSVSVDCDYSDSVQEMTAEAESVAETFGVDV